MYETTNFLRFLFLLIIIIFIYKSYCYKCKENFFQDTENILIQTSDEQKTEFIVKNVPTENFKIKSDITLASNYEYEIEFIEKNEDRQFIKFNNDSEVRIPNIDYRNFLLELIIKFDNLSDMTILKCKKIDRNNNVTDVMSLYIKNNKLILEHLFLRDNNIEIDFENDIENFRTDILHYLCISFLNNNILLKFDKVKKNKSLENGINITDIYFGGSGSNFTDIIGSIDLNVTKLDDIDFNDKTWVKDENKNTIYILNNIYNDKLIDYMNSNYIDKIQGKKMLFFEDNSFIHIPHAVDNYFTDNINFSVQFYFSINKNDDEEIRTLLSTDLLQIYIDKRNNILFYYDNNFIENLSTLSERQFGLNKLSHNFLYHLSLYLFSDEIYLQINGRYSRYNYSNTNEHNNIYIGAKFKSIIENTKEKILVSNFFNGYIGDIIINNNVTAFDKVKLKETICSFSKICADSEYTETEILSLNPNLNNDQIDKIKRDIITIEGAEEALENLRRFESENIDKPRKIDLIVRTYDNTAELNWLPPNNLDTIFKYIISIKTKKTGKLKKIDISFSNDNLLEKNLQIKDFFYPYIDEMLKNNPSYDLSKEFKINTRIPIKNYRCSNEGKNPNIDIIGVSQDINKIMSINVSVSGGVDFVKDEIIYLLPYIKNKDELKIYVREDDLSNDSEYGHPRVLIHPENESNCKMCSYKIKDLNNKYMYKIGVISVNSNMIHSTFSDFSEDDYVEVSFNNTVSIFGKEFVRDKDHVICQNDGTIDIYPEISEDQNLCKQTLKSNIGLDHNKLYDYLNTNISLNLDTDIRLT